MLRSKIFLVPTLAACLAWPCAHASGADVIFSIEPTRDNHPISRYIYGINPSSAAGNANPGLNQPAYADLNLTLARLGGNRWSAYNWLSNASNAGTDYKLSNDNFLDSSTVPGHAMIPTLEDAAAHSTATILTVPMIGFVSADENGPVPPGTDPRYSHRFIPSYPSHAGLPRTGDIHVCQDDFVKWLKAHFPSSVTKTSQCPTFFMLDNEPDLWSSTHPEVHPTPITYAELVQDSIAYSTAIKAVCPDAEVFGPASYGWGGFDTLQNAKDSAAENAAINPDTGKPYGNMLSYYLAQMSAASRAAHRPLLDALDVHWYPEATGLNAAGAPTRITQPDHSSGVAVARMNAPRSLWDPSYVETSWIAHDSLGSKPINLLTRLATDINNNYPGTRLSISEYDYGGGDDISGAVAEADVLGIFGKYGVYAAAHWPEGATEPFTLGAMRLFRNYDGKGSAFGDMTVCATTTDPADTSIYASTDSTHKGRLVVIAINRTTSPITAEIKLPGDFSRSDSCDVFQLTANSRLTGDGLCALPTPLGSFSTAELSHFSMPAESVSAIVVSKN